MTLPPEGFGALLRDLLAERDLSVRALARQVPIDAGQLSRVLNGRRLPSVNLARRCDAIFGTGDLLARAARQVRAQAAAATLVPPGRASAGTAPPDAGSVPDLLGEEVVAGDGREPLRVWNIAPAVRAFCGRDAEIGAIHKALRARSIDDSRAAVVAVHGIAGVGKTQLVRAFADRYRGDYQLGWWITAETRLEMVTGLGQLAVRLGALPEWSPAELLTYAFDQLRHRDSWLLVLDNATGPVDVAPFLPPAGRRQAHVVLTSRNPTWRLLATPIPVDVLGLEAATELLEANDPGEPETLARSLAQELGQLPLALAQAAAYASETDISAGEYLELFRAERTRLLRCGQALSYPSTVVTAVTLSLDHLATAYPTALRLLEICALYAPDHLPLRDILSALSAAARASGAQRPEARESDEWQATGRQADDWSWAAVVPSSGTSGVIERLEILRALRQSGLMTVEDEESVRMHRLTRLIIEERTTAADERLYEAVDVLAALFPETPSEPDTWPICARLLPHARATFAHAARRGIVSVALAGLLSRVGRYLLCTGLGFPDARDLHEDALAMRRRLHDGDHPEVARALVHLAVDLNELGDSAHARDLHHQALAMRRRLHPGDHVDLAHSLDNLGNVLHVLREYEQARQHHEQALAMRRRLHIEDHADLAYSLSNLASDLHELGDLDRARELNEQALAMRRRMDPGDHPDVAHSLTSLAADLHVLGEYARAIDLEEQALAMRRRLYPGDHPNTVRSLRSLAANHRALDHADITARLASEARDIELRLTTQWTRATA